MDTRVDLGDLPVDTSAPVLVTGATGYVAGWIVKGLLDAGATVHAAVRDPGNTDKVRHLLAAADASPGTLRLFASDLLQDGSYREAMQDCRTVIHTASPFIRTVRDPQRDLVDPAVHGTRNVLNTATEVASVERVVLTSSIAAMVGDAQDVQRLPGRIVTEETWNTTSSLTHEPYSYSKTLAEREAWTIAQAQDRWRLVTVNPGLVIGPSLNPDPTSESFAIARQMASGEARFGAPRIALAVVDVREVAYAHLAAAFLPEAKGRHLVVAETTDIVDLGRRLLPAYGATLGLPRRAVPKPLAVALAPVIKLPRAYVRRNIGFDLRSDTTKSRRALGVRYRPAQQSMEEMVGQLVASKTPKN
ncbi:NAD-dependent epimerase/dehydratase family protein [Kitasatospora xanthocidica]|uniref:NAD-dependent epimerase/dehydratase family protein n=1 Tax=Kitasatospora xanthocidica TaxID=83382 RepID=A0A372ZMD6_9ACTN|nr:NAD-dependent epimerase/dehydratase family protein [Kitasatospora xanthocidica]RGD56395.1 NAD-dependent epimerase/dehydratase family protein [Kitasatospora xanthocidica]